ncbi:OsmC-like protein [Shewanella piezotolerans WP3]|uniref:OsmC-like protein n=1 Tax=Shewanella piezotolerans (strain WP3 / JCM 13877) TaxID=225849 RepID=B8CRW1_SHEPW|nr:OsmC family protein [Shewanella piezotolerans]ACJ30119.1 OsmC-like protein [Shewanella piezotolerans WP3]
MSFNIDISWMASVTSAKEPAGFCRDHNIVFGSGQQVNASSAPEYSGNSAFVNPEESLLAALSSCHMLTFLTIAHLKRLPVVSYYDHAEAELGKNEQGKLFVNRITLQPQITFAEGVEVSEDVIAKIHQKSHANCFIANSLNPETIVEILTKELSE